MAPIESIRVVVKTNLAFIDDLHCPSVQLDSTVLELKRIIQSLHPKRPSPSQQKLIYGGKIIADDECLKHLIMDYTQTSLVLHLALRPGIDLTVTPIGVGSHSLDIPASQSTSQTSFSENTNDIHSPNNGQHPLITPECSHGVEGSLQPPNNPIPSDGHFHSPMDGGIQNRSNPPNRMNEQHHGGTQPPLNNQQEHGARNGRALPLQLFGWRIVIIGLVLFLMLRHSSPWSWVFCLIFVIGLSYWSHLQLHIHPLGIPPQSWMNYLDWRDYSGVRGEVLGIVVPFFLSMLPFWRPEHYAPRQPPPPSPTSNNAPNEHEH